MSCDPKILTEHFTQTQKSIPSFQHLMYFSKRGHILRHRTVPVQTGKNPIMSCILSDNHELKLDINNYRKLANTWKLNNSLLSENGLREKLKNKRLSSIWRKWIDNISKIMRYNEDGSKRQAHSTKYPHKEIE